MDAVNQSWPLNYPQIMRDRFARRARISVADNGQAMAMLYYKNRPADWIDDWAITFDPRRAGTATDPRLLPFMMFQRQREFVRFLEDCKNSKESGLAEKARDMGLTWVSCAYSVHQWLYHPGSIIGWGSRKEEYVDDAKEPKAIFPKMRQIIENLPKWQLPVGFNMRVHGTYMKLINPENDSVISGEAGDNIGRGGRTTMYFKDESAHYERPELIEAALGDNTEVQIDISSVNGSGNVFHRRRMAGTVWEPNKETAKGYVRVFVMDWRDHPGKSQAWYDERKKKAEREGLLHIFYQEVDRDYASSIVGIIIRPEWLRACIDADKILAARLPEADRAAYLQSWRSGEHIAANDIADGGLDTNAYASRHCSVLLRVEDWSGEAGDAARHGMPMAIEDNAHEYYYDSIGVGAGFKTEANTMRRENLIPSWMRILPWSAAAEVLDPQDHIIPDDDQTPTNEDQYENLKAQAWFRMRSRVWKTYLAVERGNQFHPSEMFCIPAELPNRERVIMEMAQAVKKTAKSGKTLVDKTPDGTKSPNLAEAVIMCFNPTREVSSFDIV